MFLTEKFQQFHAEVLRLQSRVVEGTWAFAGEGSEAKESPGAVWRRLHSMLERQLLDAGREGGDLAIDLYRRAQYAMAALADEIFLNLDWIGRDAWRDHLLESKLFGSQDAGQELFERIEEILRDRDSKFLELARIYLTVLALGFQGKYRGRIDSQDEINQYRHRLYRFIFGRDPQVPRGAEHVIPQAYASTLDESGTTTLPYLRPWVWALVFVILLWAGGSYFLWHAWTAPLQPCIEEILDGRKPLGGNC
jgi:type VI secretion system protein ImpK